MCSNKREYWSRNVTSSINAHRNTRWKKGNSQTIRRNFWEKSYKAKDTWLFSKKKKTKTLSNNDEKSPRKPKKILKQKQRTKCDENDDSESNNEKERYVDNTISKIEEISFN